MADAGCDDILVPFNIVGPRSSSACAACSSASRSRSPSTTQRSCPASPARRPGRREELGVLVDCDTGLGRTGVTTPRRRRSSPAR